MPSAPEADTLSAELRGLSELRWYRLAKFAASNAVRLRTARFAGERTELDEDCDLLA